MQDIARQVADVEDDAERMTSQLDRLVAIARRIDQQTDVTRRAAS